MGQKQKARAIVEELFEFQATTRLSADDVLASAGRAAEASKKMGGGVRSVKEVKGDDGDFAAAYQLKGPAGAVTVMSFTLRGTRSSDDSLGVRLEVSDFLYQKGSLGMKPSINGKKVMLRFVEVLKTELAAG